MFDLDAYLARIGLTGRPSLEQVHRAHATSIPFENLDPLRGEPVSLVGGCTTHSLPLGTSIYSGEVVNGGVQNGTLIGTLAYNSWLTMQSKNETDPNRCAFNDLALIKITSSQVANVNPH
jgi:hypothetical protein